MFSQLPVEMLEYYAANDEGQRLGDATGDLERVRTQDLLRRHLLPPPQVILDVGGGTGVHALWLARQGYQVHLIDPVQRHVEQAAAASATLSSPLVSAVQADARGLPFEDATADAVLLFGPLYHLTAAADRRLALLEAKRVLRPDGVLFAACVSRFASLHNALHLGLLDDPEFVELVRQDLTDGQHRNPPGRPYFTTTYFHRPEDLDIELAEAGFADAQLVAVEGPAMWAATLDADWADERRRTLILEFLRTIETEPVMIASGAHFIGIAHA